MIKDSTGNSLDSDIITISFGSSEKKPITIKTQPENVATGKGEMINLSVEAEGEGLTYQWQYRTNATGKWKNFSAATTASIRKLTGDWDGWQVKCVIKDNAGNSLDSDIITITFGGGQEEFAIVSQPEDVTTKKGETVEFAVKVTGENVSYQWQYRTSAAGAWKNFASATTASIKKVTGDWDGWQVRCIVKDGTGKSLESRIANISFGNKETIEIIRQPEDIETEKGASVELSVEAKGNNLTYQWQYRTSASGSWKKFASATAASIRKVTGDWNGWQVRCVIKDGANNSVTTNIATFKFVEKALEITQQPTDMQVQPGEAAEFTVKVNKDKVTYQWETRGAYQSEFTAVKDAVESTLHVTADTKNNGQVYRCVITDSDGHTVTSEEAALHIQYQNPIATFVNASTMEVITTVEAEAFEATAGLPAGKIVYLPKEISEKTYSYYTVENGNQIPVNLDAVVEGSSASYADLKLFFYVNGDQVVYVTL